MYDTDYDWADPRRSCYRKKRYRSMQTAKAVARNVNILEEAPVVRPYACRHCGGFHIGRNPAQEN